MPQFRDDAQRNAVCMALLERAGKPALWSAGGPTDEARQLHQRRGEGLSREAQVLLMLAFDVLDAEHNVAVTELLEDLGRRHRAAVARLLLAYGEGAAGIDEWLQDNRRHRLLEKADDADIAASSLERNHSVGKGPADALEKASQLREVAARARAQVEAELPAPGADKAAAEGAPLEFRAIPSGGTVPYLQGREVREEDFIEVWSSRGGWKKGRIMSLGFDGSIVRFIPGDAQHHATPAEGDATSNTLRTEKMRFRWAQR